MYRDQRRRRLSDAVGMGPTASVSLGLLGGLHSGCLSPHSLCILATVSPLDSPAQRCIAGRYAQVML
jgi:hypothetical protein